MADTGYRFYRNNLGYVEALPWAGNIPTGYTPITQEEFLRVTDETGAQTGMTRQWWEQRIPGITTQQNVDSGLTLVDGKPVTTSSIEQAKQEEAAVAAGTMTKVPVGSGFGYVPVGSPGEAQLQGKDTSTMTFDPKYGTQSLPTTPTQSNQGMQLQFYKPDPNDPTVYVNDGQSSRPISLQEYKALTGQNDVPDNQLDWSRVQNGSIPQSGTQDPNAKPPVTGGPTGIQNPGVLGDPNFSTGVPELDAMYQRLSKYLEDLISAGQKLNPNIELTPQEVQRFMDQATSEIEPFYKQQFDTIKEDVRRSLDSLQKNYDLAKQDREAQFKQTLAGARESAADRGVIFSGGRAKTEQDIAQAQTRDLESLGLSVSNQAGNLLRSGASQIGSRNLSGLGIPSLSTYNATTSGEGALTPGRSLDFYTPTDMTGSLEYQQRADQRQLADFLTQQEVQKRSLTFT